MTLPTYIARVREFAEAVISGDPTTIELARIAGKSSTELSRLCEALEVADRALSEDASVLACTCCDSAETVQKHFDEARAEIQTILEGK